MGCTCCTAAAAELSTTWIQSRQVETSDDKHDTELCAGRCATYIYILYIYFVLNRSEICLCASLCVCNKKRINNAKNKGPGTISTHVALECQGKGKGKGRGRRGESLELSLEQYAPIPMSFRAFPELYKYLERKHQ